MDLAAHPVTLLALVLTILTAGLAVTLLPERLDDAALARAADRLDLVAGLAAHELHALAGGRSPTADHLAALAERLPTLAFADGRVAYLSDGQGFIVGRTGTARRGPRTLSELFEPAEPDGVGGPGASMVATLRDGTPVLASTRGLAAGHLTVIQPRAAVRAPPSYVAPVGLAVAFAVSLGGFAAGCVRYRRHASLARLDRTRLTQRLDTSLARGRCGVWDWDIARDRIHWSASLYELLGYEPRGEHLEAREVAAIIHPDDGILDVLRAARDLVGPEQIDRDIRARTACGTWRWLRIKAEGVIDAQDGSRHVIGFAVDVTDERGAEERRANDDVRLRDAVEAISEAFVLWDAEDRLILCNSKFLKLHGVPPERAVPGTASHEVLAAGRRPIVEKQLPSARPSQPGNRTVETQLSDGRWLHVSERRTKEGGLVSVGTDVSDLKRQEARLRERERRLQGSVRAAETEAQRFADLAERNHELAERHQEANLAKTEFLARMSHELRTPLTAIIGFSDVMRQEIFGALGSARYSEYAQDIHASGIQLLEVIDGILQMARIERGQVRLAPELTRIESALAGALAVVGAEASERRIAVETDIVEPAILYADVDALREVFAQLLRNAVKFSRIGGLVRVRVRPADGSLNVFVEDAGIGIPAEILPRLGQPFEQLEAEYCRSGGGSGLGLAIARAFVEMHGGRLRLRSQPGIGTIALVHLPLVQPPANDAAPDWTAAPALVAAE